MKVEKAKSTLFTPITLTIEDNSELDQIIYVLKYYRQNGGNSVSRIYVDTLIENIESCIIS